MFKVELESNKQLIESFSEPNLLGFVCVNLTCAVINSHEQIFAVSRTQNQWVVAVFDSVSVVLIGTVGLSPRTQRTELICSN